MKNFKLKHSRYGIIVLFSIYFIGLKTHAQLEKSTDNKGSIIDVRNNQVTTATTAPANPLESDVWFDNSDTNNIVTKVYDDTTDSWINISTGTAWNVLGNTGTSVATNFLGTTDANSLAIKTNNTQRMVINAQGNVGIGNTSPHVNAVLDLTNTSKRALLLPSETQPTGITSPSEGMLVYASGRKNAYLRADNVWKPIAYNRVVNELIFDGIDDTDATNDNFYYVSFVVNDNWKVIRYDKTDVNIEDYADQTTNPSQTTQPITLAECFALIF